MPIRHYLCDILIEKGVAITRPTVDVARKSELRRGKLYSDRRGQSLFFLHTAV